MSPRHCEEQSDDPSSLAAQAPQGSSPPKRLSAKAEAIQLSCRDEGKLDCFAEPVIGRAFARPVGSQ
jgi:hypothetical protein